MIGLYALVATVAGCGSGPDTGVAPPTDADGDHVYTPDDCDEANDLVYPGAPEYCDAIDQDCDGEPLSEGGCAQQAPLHAMVSGLLVDDENISAVGLVPDLIGLAKELAVIDATRVSPGTTTRSARPTSSRRPSIAARPSTTPTAPAPLTPMTPSATA